MQSNQSIISIGGVARYFPSAESYNLVFITGILLSIIAVALAIVLRRRAVKMAIPNLE
jgi:hypothetical protein